MHLLIISTECSHVKQNIHKRIVKNYFIRGDHSLAPSSLALSSSHTPLKCYLSGLSVHWSCSVCVCVCLACLHTPTRTRFPGDTQLRLQGGWQRDGQMGRRGEGKGDSELGGHQGGEVMRGVAGQGATKQGEARRVAWQQGLLVSWSPSLSLLVAFSRAASAACFTCKTHPVERASSHGAKGTKKKSIPEAVLGEKGGGALQQPLSKPCLPQIKPWGDAVMRDERINSLQIIFALALKLISMCSPCYCFVMKRISLYTRPDTGITSIMSFFSFSIHFILQAMCGSELW